MEPSIATAMTGNVYTAKLRPTSVFITLIGNFLSFPKWVRVIQTNNVIIIKLHSIYEVVKSGALTENRNLLKEIICTIVS